MPFKINNIIMYSYTFKKSIQLKYTCNKSINNKLNIYSRYCKLNSHYCTTYARYERADITLNAYTLRTHTCVFSSEGQGVDEGGVDLISHPD